MDASRYLDRSLVDAAAAIRSGQVSPVELARAAIARIESDPANAACFTRLNPERAEQQARRLERQAAESLPLAGIPMAHKDLFAVEGETTTMCAYPDFHVTADYTAPVIRKLEAAGTVTLGALHMSEFAMGAAGWNEIQGYLPNPTDPALVTGGSSSGSAAAVARRLVFAALGTDTGGSIRVPASFCGVVGFKPSNGAVSLDGVYPVSTSLDTVGTFTRSAGDCRAVMSVLTGGAIGDGYAGGDKFRIGRLRPEDLPVEPDASAMEAVDQACHAAQQAGHTVIDVASDIPVRAAAQSGVVFLSEAGTVHLGHLQDGMERIGPQVRNRLLLGLTYPASSFILAKQTIARLLRRWQTEVVRAVDVVLCPSTPGPAPAIASYAGLDANAAIAANGRLGGYTAWVNGLGLPALSLPVPCEGRPPQGVQLIGGLNADNTVLAVAESIEWCL